MRYLSSNRVDSPITLPLSSHLKMVQLRVLGILASTVITSAIDSQKTTDISSDCRALPGDAAWPSESKWDQLNSTVGGRLIASLPLGSVCHDPHYDEKQCNYLRENWDTPQTYLDNPVTPMGYWFQNSTCDPWVDRKLPCELGNSAEYAIGIASPADAIAGVKFAHENNIRLTIKNTGHDYLGKSVGKGSLAVWTHHLDSIEVKKDYDQSWYKGPAIKFGSGVSGIRAIEAARDAGLRVPGGACPTAGFAGGFIQGGGHSPLSGAYGMAADTALEWEVVLADGTLIIATPQQNEDMYFALSGGGGSTFGVIISVTVCAFPDGTVGGASLSIDREGLSNDTFWKGVTSFQKALPDFNKAGAQTAFVVTGTRFDILALTLPDYKDENQVRQLISSFTADLDSLGLKYNLTVSISQTYVDHFGKYFGPLPWGTVSIGALASGRFIPLSVSQASPEKIVSAYREIVDNTQILLASTAQDVSINSDRKPVASNSVMPGWRNALQLIILESNFRSNISWSDKQALESQLVDFAEQHIDSLVPNDTGAYLNEANFSPEIDWKTQFYGSNYQKLLDIKHKYDPNNVFWAATAVGSDAMTVASDGRLCTA
ncbi:FAD/FMN-containing isoamyl alcohol oxidase MreA [Annulohypoxylon nitens]|nr:FAD/FMN-containing isoamyl alcohol oxidase MreA [Annulohypoxylon nitens]